LESETDVPDHRCVIEHSWWFKNKNATARRAVKKLVLVTMVCMVFCGIELVGGLWSDSLAILTDAAHQFSDVAGFVISFVAICMSTKKGNARYSYGYHRADVLGALGSIVIIWGLLIWLLLEAVNRLKHYKEIEINGDIMLITACIGLGCNILNLLLLQFCMNETDVKGKPKDFRSSIASAYKYKGVGGLSNSMVLQDGESKPKEQYPALK